jgi:hypothetical protein
MPLSSQMKKVTGAILMDVDVDTALFVMKLEHNIPRVGRYHPDLNDPSYNAHHNSPRWT